MASRYDPAPAEVAELAQRLIANRHRPLIDAGVTITYLFAHNPDGPAVQHNGYPAAATVQRTTAKARAAGHADAIITIDGDQWPAWSDEKRAALLEHELYHLEVQYDDGGALKLDKAGRPALKLRKHDIVIGGFSQVIEWHGKEAVEAQQIYDARQYVQDFFAWG
jgi:hypothetical protein